MSTTLPVSGVLADRVLPKSLLTDAVLVVGGAALTAGLAQVAIPLHPVPVTGQTLAVVLVGASLGATRGMLSMALYVAAGMLGAPVFADHASGVAEVLGASGGYLVGFLPAAIVTGWLAEHRAGRRIPAGMLACTAGSAVVFLVGLPWLHAALDLTWRQTFAGGLVPFIVPGLVKAAIAAALLRGAWALVARADRSTGRQ